MRTHLETVFVETGLWGATNDKKSLLGLEGFEGRHWEVRALYSTGHKGLHFCKGRVKGHF